MNAGRHRSFDMEVALDNAMQVFWTNGYPGTSLADLTRAMGINKSSMYTAFGNKEALFKSALDRYVEKYGLLHSEQLFIENRRLPKRIENYLTSIAKMVTDKNLPSGCLMCISTCEAAGTCLPSTALHAVNKINEVTKSSFIKFFKAEKAAGNITSKNTPAMMANYLMTLQYGLAVMGRNGASLKELVSVIDFSISNIL